MTSDVEVTCVAANSKKLNPSYERPSVSYAGNLLELTEGRNPLRTTKDALKNGTCTGAQNSSNDDRACSI